jgi:hypothetical protein
MRRVQARFSTLLAATLLLVGCNFDDAVEACLKSGRCLPEAGTTADADAGTDAGATGDAGVDDAGEVVDAGPPDAGTRCDGGFNFLGAVCRSGWCWQHPLPQGNPLNGVHGAEDRVWVVGDHGTVLQIDGCAVSSRELPGLVMKGPDEHLRAVHALSKTDVAVASGARVHRYLDGGWPETLTPGVRSMWSMPGGTGRILGTGNGTLFDDQMPLNTVSLPYIYRVRSRNDDVVVLADAGLYLGPPANPLRVLDLASTLLPNQGLWVTESGEIILALADARLLRYVGPGNADAVVPEGSLTRPGGGNLDLTSVVGAPDGRLWVGGLPNRVYEVPAGGPARLVHEATGNFPVNDLYLGAGRVWGTSGDGQLLTLDLAEDGGTMTGLRRAAVKEPAALRAIAATDTGAWAVGQREVLCSSGGEWSACALTPHDPINGLQAAAVLAGDEVWVGGGQYLGRVTDGGLVEGVVKLLDGGLLTAGTGNWTIRNIHYEPGFNAMAAGSDSSGGIVFQYKGGGEWLELTGNPTGFAAALTGPNGDRWGLATNGTGNFVPAGGGTTPFTVGGAPRVAYVHDDGALFVAHSAGIARCQSTPPSGVSCQNLWGPDGLLPAHFWAVTRGGPLGPPTFFGTRPDGTAVAYHWTSADQAVEIAAPPAAGIRAATRAPDGGVYVAGERGAILYKSP